MRAFFRVSVLALVLCALLSSPRQSWAQGTLQITFDGPPLQPPGTAFSVQDYVEAGLAFSVVGVIGPGNTFTRVGAGGAAGQAQNGTAYLRAALTQSLMFSFTNGSVFDLRSVDLAEYSTVVPDAVTVHFIGYRSDGSTVTTDLTTEGIIDGTGPLADFQTFNFGPQFSRLTRVEIPTYGWSLDNLVVSTIPEPRVSQLLLLGTGLAAFYLLKRKP